MGGFDLLKVGDASGLVDAVANRSVQLFLLDVHDTGLPLAELIDALAAPGAQRLVPVLIVGRGDDALNVKAKLRGHFAVRTVDMDTGDAEGGPGSVLRRHRRVSLRIPVWAEGISGGLGQSHDLSEEGLGVVSTLSARPGELFRVRFSLPDGWGDVSADAEVRRAVSLAGGGVFLGLWFRNLDRSTRHRLRDFVQSIGDTENS